MDLHDLTAAYALDALDPDEAEAYERHLGQCEDCREQLAGLGESAAALAYGVVAPSPPPELRASILDAAAAERTNVVPLLRHRWVARGLGVAAAAVACVVVGLVVASSRSGQRQVFTVVVDRNGSATMSVTGLAAAPQGKTYEAWVIPKKGGARPAGLFHGGPSTSMHLDGRVPPNATIAVTVERAGGVGKPTTTPIFSTPT